MSLVDGASDDHVVNARLLGSDEQSAVQLGNSSRRLSALDAFKGIICILMALDHVKHDFAGAFGAVQQDPVPFENFFTPADYSGPFFWWWTRLVTHTVAVGFAFALGAGLWLLYRSRKRSGWTDWQIFRFYAIRGALLVVIEQAVNWTMFVLFAAFRGLAWSRWFFSFGVLEMLGVNMICSCLLLFAQVRLNAWKRFAGDLFVLLFLIVNALISFFLVRIFFNTVDINYALAWFAVPERLNSQAFSVMYPWFPWLAPVMFGALLAQRGLSRVNVALSGAFCLAGFILLRFLYVFHSGFDFGNYRVILDPLSGYSFFGMAKYPPSLVFLFFWTFVDMAILLLLLFIPEPLFDLMPLKILMVFGSAPLFFYAMHLIFYAIISLPFPLARSTTLPGIYLEWIIGLVLLYFPTKYYAKFKSGTQKDSIWRFF